MLWALVRRWWWLLPIVVAASACQASFDVVVEVDEDGSGVVETTMTIDGEAAEGLLDLDLDADGIVLADLARSGWGVDRPDVAPDGTTVIVASKEFGTPEQFAELMAELAGPDGPFQEFDLQRTKSFAQVDYELSGRLDASGDLDVFGDPALEAALGQSLMELAETYGADPAQVSFSFELTLPGDLQGERPARLVPSDEGTVAARWEASLAADDVQQVELATATSNVVPVVLIGLAVVLAVIALLVVLAFALRILLPDRRRRPPRRPPSPDPAPPRVEPSTGQMPAVPVGERGTPFSVVALDVMGVLYRPADDVTDMLIPFVRQRTVTKPTDDEIRSKARALSSGRITTEQFWQALGVRGLAAKHDADYLALHQLTPGVVKYLRSLRDHGVRVATLTNYAAAWAVGLRASHSLEGLIDPWVVSGNIGVRLPDPAMFEALRRLTQTEAAQIQVISVDLDILDAARDFGFATTWFAPEGTREAARNHTLVRSFGVVEGEVAPAVAPAGSPGPGSGRAEHSEGGGPGPSPVDGGLDPPR